MTETEVKSVVRLFCLAHDDCYYCSASLCRTFLEEFPEWTETVKKEYLKFFPNEVKRVYPLWLVGR